MKARYLDYEKIFEKPKGDMLLWRYMTFTKFVSLLEKRALFFCRADKIGDPFEGSAPKHNVDNRFHSGKPLVMAKVFKEMRKHILLNCWNLSDSESTALWGLYTNGSDGIALQSSFDRLKDSFSTEGKEVVHIGKVKYIDFSKESYDDHDCFFSQFLYKMKSFQHENEVRAMIMKFPDGMKDYIEVIRGAEPVFDVGCYVDVDLETLIENVYVSPDAPLWFRELVESVLKKYSLNRCPKWTDLHNEPIY
jgi:hypothetical protein